MAGEQNLERTKQAYAAFAASDVEGASENLADDIEWIVPGNSKIGGTYRGKDEVIGFWMNLAEKSFTTSPEHFLADDDRVVVLTSTTADGHSSDSVDVLTFRDGKVVKFQSAVDTALQEHIWGSK
jgi:ketosteroid isomerase-like protein